ncbi:MAG: hypothetical protein ACQESR_19810 [Planctomycetota bacterium]
MISKTMHYVKWTVATGLLLAYLYAGSYFLLMMPGSCVDLSHLIRYKSTCRFVWPRDAGPFPAMRVFSATPENCVFAPMDKLYWHLRPSYFFDAQEVGDKTDA